jgi:hypothetical protein
MKHADAGVLSIAFKEKGDFTGSPVWLTIFSLLWDKKKVAS